MEQDDFRKLLSSRIPRADDSSSNKKRPRDRAFGQGRQTTAQSTTSFLAPRTKRNAISSSTPQTERISIGSKEKQAKSLLADGYTDRTKQRQGDLRKDENQDKLDQLKNDLKLKKISHKEYLEQVETFAKGDFSQSGMVRGLDKKLLERVRAGEDVLGLQKDDEVVKTEEELDQALDKLEWNTKDETNHSESAQPATSNSPHNSRDAILDRMKQSRSTGTRAASPKSTEVTTASAFIPITKRNKDGTTTESFNEKGKKIKIIRDSTGKIVKKLVKKAENPSQDKPEAPVEDTPTSPNQDVQSLPAPVAIDQSFEDEGDIFDNVGEYDPYSVTTTDENLDKDRQIETRRRNYFTTTSRATDNIDRSEEGDVPISTKEFLTQNKAALEKAAKIVDAQEKVEQERLAAKQKRDAGFGLVFKDSDAYAGDLRDVPEDDEIYDKKRDGHRRDRGRVEKEKSSVE